MNPFLSSLDKPNSLNLSCNHLCDCLVNPFHVFSVLRIPELDGVLQAGSHQHGAEGQNLLPIFLWIQPRIQLALWAAGTHCWLMSSFSSSSSPKSFFAGLLSSPFICQILLIPVLAWLRHTTLYLTLMNFMRFPGLCRSPSARHPVPQACQLHHATWCHLQACWACTQSLCLCCWWRQTVLVLVGTPEEHHWLLISIQIDHYSLDMTIWAIPYPLNSPSITVTYLSLLQCIHCQQWFTYTSGIFCI